MALPYDSIAPAFVAIAFGLIMVFVTAPAIAHARRAGTARTSRIQVVVGIALAVLVGGAVGLRALGAPIDPDSQPLGFGNAFGGDDPRLIALWDAPGSDTFPQRQQYDYAYSPGAEIRNSFTLSNAGGTALTVSAIDAAVYEGVRSVDFRLPARLSPDLPPTYPGQDPNLPSAAWASQPFHAFDIPASSQVGLGVAVTLGVCIGASPLPTLAPGASLLPGDKRTLGGGFDVLWSIDVRYVQLGIERTASITMPFVMHVNTGATYMYGCPPAAS